MHYLLFVSQQLQIGDNAVIGYIPSSSSGATLASFTIAPQSLKVSQELKLFTGWGCQPQAQPPTWKARVSLFVWIITFGLSGMGDSTSSYATTSIGLRII
jgi:hypothetical protein